MDSRIGMTDELSVVRGRWRPHDVKSWKLPFGKGRLMYTRDTGNALRLANEQFVTHLSATHRDGDGKIKDVRDLGSGTITNVATLSIANDFNWAGPSGAPINTLRNANYHAVGTGVTSSSVLDIQLQTPAAPTATTAVTGTQSLVAGSTGGDAASVQIYKTIGVTNFSGSAAITEWGLLTAPTLSATTGSPWTSGTSTTGTATSTPFTASSSTVQGQQQYVFYDTTAGSPFWGLCLSNTTSIITVPLWYTQSTGGVSASNPTNGDSYKILPVLFDHQVFSALNVISGDSVTWTFQCQFPSGG